MTRTDDAMRSRWAITLLLLGVTIAASLSVLAINRGPLVYFDTGSYVRQGNVVLSMVLPAAGEPDSAARETQKTRNTADDDQTAGGSRSIFYAVLVAGFWRVGWLAGLAWLQLGLVLMAVWLAMRMLGRAAPTTRSTAQMVCLPLLAASTTSLPFYVAYVMPDIFTPVMLILVAAVVAAGHRMHVAEALGALALGTFSVVLHPSHLGIAVLMVPLVVLAAALRIGQGRWLAAGFAMCLAFFAIAERKAFEVAVETVTHKDVVYTPHITARLIVDGPGLAYLNDVCPAPDLATCALHEALTWSDDPYRLTASHIIFERSPRLGSFRLLPPEDQQAIALEQRQFFLRVLSAYPVATVTALGQNALRQLGTHSVAMTIPNSATIRNAKKLSGLSEDQLAVLDKTTLKRSQTWIDPLVGVHFAIYAVSAVIVAVLLLWPAQVAAPYRVFTLFLLIGIAVNALVCGGVSQPADRYGARVMWLLPFAATLLVLVRNPRSRPRTPTEDE